jgi:hypothetical protein
MWHIMHEELEKPQLHEKQKEIKAMSLLVSPSPAEVLGPYDAPADRR